MIAHSALAREHLASTAVGSEHRAVLDASHDSMTRRDFLGVAALGVPFLRAVQIAHARIAPLGIQLYTVRALMAKDPDATLAALAQIGYREVELAGLYGLSAVAMRAMLDKHHLDAVSSHVTLDAMRDDWSRCVRDAHTLGQRYLVCSWIDEGERTADGYARVATTFNALGERARDAGLQFCYHNGDYVHVALPNGLVPYELLLATCDLSLVQFEIDLYWMIAGGGDPIATFARYPGRFPMLHVKDRTLAGRMADVGAGAIDFPAIFAHARAAGVRHYFVEHDDPADALASARASYAYLSALEIP